MILCRKFSDAKFWFFNLNLRFSLCEIFTHESVNLRANALKSKKFIMLPNLKKPNCDFKVKNFHKTKGQKWKNLCIFSLLFAHLCAFWL